MALLTVFHKYRGLKNFTLAELLAIVDDLLPKLVKGQERYKVSERPSERTVRFYIGRGLVDKPCGRSGTASLFEYRHLLQVLAVKYLQSQYLPLRKIASMLSGRTNRELERLLPVGGAARSGRLSLDATPVIERRRSPLETGALPDPRERWQRVTLAPGMELHVRDDAAATRPAPSLDTVIREFRRTIERLTSLHPKQRHE